MKLVADDKGRITCRDIFPPGSVFDANADAAGNVELKKLVPVEPRPIKSRLIKKDGYTVITTDRPVDMKVIKELLAEFP